MAVKASATITLTSYRDTQSVTRYYKLQPAGSSAPLKPETKPPSSDWTDSEPACDISKELYFCDLTIFSNGEGEYSSVSKSTSYEAAKQAYNRADNAQASIDNLKIGGRNLFIETDYENIKTQGYLDVPGWYQMSNIKNLIVDDNSEKAAKTAGNSWNIAQYVNVEAGETYTMSCFARLETGRSGAKLCFRPDVLQVVDYNFDKDLTTDYQKLTYTWTCGVGGIERIHIRTGHSDDVMYVKKIKFEKGNRATDWTPAPEDVDEDIDNVWEKADDAQTSIDNLEIGGRNLFLNTGVAVSWNDYLITTYKYANEPLKEGEIYTATICVTPAENLSEIRVYFSQGYLSPVSFSITETSKQIISKTFTMAYYDGRTPDIYPSYGYADLYRFPNDGTVTGNTTVHWFKIEKGNKATDWTPAPEDIESRTTVLEDASAKELVRNGFAEFTNDPKLTLGKTTSPWKVVVKNDGIFLQKSSNDVASLSKETSSEETTLRADNARLANVKFRSANGGGKLGIVAQSNGHVSLKEI